MTLHAYIKGIITISSVEALAMQNLPQTFRWRERLNKIKKGIRYSRLLVTFTEYGAVRFLVVVLGVGHGRESTVHTTLLITVSVPACSDERGTRWELVLN